jgi:hypothetical protein
MFFFQRRKGTAELFAPSIALPMRSNARSPHSKLAKEEKCESQKVSKIKTMTFLLLPYPRLS